MSESIFEVIKGLTRRRKESAVPLPELEIQWEYTGRGGYLSTLGRYWFAQEDVEDLQDKGYELIKKLSSAVSVRYPKAQKTLEGIAGMNPSLTYIQPSGDVYKVVEDLKDIKGHLINPGSACGTALLYVAAKLPKVDIDGFDGDVCGLFVGERLKQNPLILQAYGASIYLDNIRGTDDVKKDFIDASQPFLRLRQVMPNDADLLEAALQEVFNSHDLSIDKIPELSDMLGVETIKRMLDSSDRVRLYLGLGEVPDTVIDKSGEVRELPKGYYSGGWDLDFWHRFMPEDEKRAKETFSTLLKPDAKYCKH